MKKTLILGLLLAFVCGVYGSGNVAKLNPPKVTMAMWDFSWLRGHYPGGPFEDWGKALDEAKVRGFNTVRIEAFPLLIDDLHQQGKETILVPAAPHNNWGQSSKDVEHNVAAELVEFMEITKEKGVYVILSTWNDIVDRSKYTKFEDYWRAWELVLDMLDEKGLLSHVLYVDFDQEFPHFSPFNAQLGAPPSAGDSGSDMENAGSTVGTWNGDQRAFVKDYFESTLAHFNQKYPEMPFTFSMTTHWEEARSLNLKGMGLLELHFWIHEPMDKYTGFNSMPKTRNPDIDYKEYMAKIDDAMKNHKEDFKADMIRQLEFATAWADELGVPLTTSEAWGPWWHMDHPDLEWQWLYDWCEYGMGLSGDYGFWGSTPWNYSHPYWENWDNIEWYQRVNTKFLNSPPRSEISQSKEAAALDQPDPFANETRQQRDERMAWWREAKFGMFIHWGVYAVPAGTYKDEQIDGYGEWIMHEGKIPINEYQAYAEVFNPTQYDPEAWAQLAKEAGMKYMVITAKHHDGFSLFPSDVTDWDVADATPYGKDLIGPLAEAAREEGLKFGLYYSQSQDWTHPGGAARGGEWDDSHKGDMDAYIDSIAVPQVKEILTRYQPDVLWWDTPEAMNDDKAKKLISLLRYQPNIIHNNRLGGEFNGDTDTPEQRIPATGFEDRDWEVCMTMNETWGYKTYDHDWKSTESLIRKLSDIVSKGGNFLLNVGPTKEGLIPQPSIDRLREVGAWMDLNGESIYGTTASPFYRLTWGRCTKKIHPNGAVLYLHVFDWPKNGKLILEGLKNNPSSITLLQGGKELSWKELKVDEPGISIDVPKEAPDAISTVIKLEIEGELEVE